MENYDELRANGDSFFLRGPTAERVSQVPSPKPGGKTPDYLRGLVDEEVSVRVGVGESQRWFWSGPGERRLRRTVLGSSTRPTGGIPGEKPRPSAPGGNRYMCPGEPLSSLSGPDSRMGPVGWRVPPGTAQPNSEGGEGGRKEDKPEASPGSSQG